MLVLPWKIPEKWRDIPGSDNCVGRDIVPESIFSLSDSEVPFLFKKRRSLAREVELLREDPAGRPLIWTLQKNRPYKAILPFIKMPVDCYAIISPRSTISKMGILCLSSSVIDPGFLGHPVVLMLPTLCVQIEPDVELFSMRMFHEEDLRPYDGFYQEKIVSTDSFHKNKD